MDFPHISKDELLDQIRTAHADLESIVAPLDEDRLAAPGIYSELALKDVLAHLAAWERMLAGWLEASLAGKPVVRFAPGFELGGDDADTLTDRLNEYTLAVNRFKSPARLRDELHTAQKQLLAVVRLISEQDLNDPHRFAWWDGEPIWTSIAGNSYRHYAEHIDLIRAWLMRTGGG